jgi:hypothetical protein
MASIKFHVFRREGTDPGILSCDFRGERFLGAEQGDYHRTIPQLEIDPASDELVARALQIGPELNSLFDEMHKAQPDSFGDIASALRLEGNGPVSLRVGVWDE